MDKWVTADEPSDKAASERGFATPVPEASKIRDLPLQARPGKRARSPLRCPASPEGYMWREGQNVRQPAAPCLDGLKPR